jgi:hypothetical protein
MTRAVLWPLYLPLVQYKPYPPSSCLSSDWSKCPPTFPPGSFRRTCVGPCSSTSNLKLQSVNSAHYGEMLLKCVTCPLSKAGTAAESYFRECDTQLPVVPAECHQETLTQQHCVSPWNTWNLNTIENLKTQKNMHVAWYLILQSCIKQ